MCIPRCSVLAAAFLAIASAVFVQEQRANVQQPLNAPLQSLAFLSGKWIGEKPGEIQEETWSSVRGDSMIGSFRIVSNGKPVFYEFWVVEMESKRPILKLKHFNPDFAGWEEKNASTRMPLVSASENDAVFAEPDGSVSLHYHRTADALTCVVHHRKNGETSDEIFKMSKASEL
jgi:hypothetical protein